MHEQYVIPSVTPSQNKIDHLHWSDRYALRNEWFWLVKIHVGVNEVKPNHPIHVHIIRIAKRFIDDQNVPAGTKYLVDALAEFNHIREDSREWARVTYDQRTCDSGEDPHMIITLTSVSAS